jgi:hypothetical protein
MKNSPGLLYPEENGRLTEPTEKARPVARRNDRPPKHRSGFATGQPATHFAFPPRPCPIYAPDGFRVGGRYNRCAPEEMVRERGRPMTEAEWLKAVDPTPMLEFLRNRASQRKLRLFGCACCRRNWNMLPRKIRQSLVTAERYAEGEISLPKLGLAMFRARLAENVENRRHETTEGIAVGAVARMCEAPPLFDHLLTAVAMARTSEQNPIDQIRLGETQAKQAVRLRDIFGNPFRPITLNPSWLTSTVVSLAQQMYDSRDFSLMPILADALQDAGCDNDDILNHCRQPGEHCRGCWVCDLLLEKQ